jgi:dynein heavy chain
MYGGHITDDWDRRTNATYLKVLFKPELLLPNFNLLYHLFKSPDPNKLDYEGYRKHIEEKLPAEVPQMFGMHPNAEIGYLTLQCETLFDTILSITAGAGAGGGAKDDTIMNLITDFKTRTPEGFNMIEITLRVKDKTPFIVVCLQ